jgi:geranylgeranyl diphosphate synthase, type I
MPTSSTPSKQPLAAFETYKQAINKSLEAYFKSLPLSLDAKRLPLVCQRALELMTEYTLGPGKRVRGALAALAYDSLTGQRLSENGQKLAVVMELVQSYILMVDDVTDKSDLRGKPTVHRRYEQLYKAQVGVREAEQLATYTGMILGHLSNLVLLEASETPERVLQSFKYVHANMVTTGFGQLEDIMQEISRAASHDEIIQKYALKTSYYTFINPLHAGMALAGVTDQKPYEQVRKFGEAAGVAFQAHDDYLGVFGGEATGKPVTDDIAEGKLTVLTQHVMASGSPDDIRTLKSHLGNPSVDKKAIAEVRTIFDRTGATMEARRIAKQYARQAIDNLQTITIWSEQFNSLLAELVTYSVNRES